MIDAIFNDWIKSAEKVLFESIVYNNPLSEKMWDILFFTLIIRLEKFERGEI
jgi:hypothetical protein